MVVTPVVKKEIVASACLSFDLFYVPRLVTGRLLRIYVLEVGMTVWEGPLLAVSGPTRLLCIQRNVRLGMWSGAA